MNDEILQLLYDELDGMVELLERTTFRCVQIQRRVLEAMQIRDRVSEFVDEETPVDLH